MWNRRHSLVGFFAAWAALLPVCVFAGAWAVVCTTSEGGTHLEVAHQTQDCASQTPPHTDEHGHPAEPCTDTPIDLDDARLTDRATEVDLPPILCGGDLLFAMDFDLHLQPPAALFTSASARLLPGPLELTRTTILLL